MPQFDQQGIGCPERGRDETIAQGDREAPRVAPGRMGHRGIRRPGRETLARWLRLIPDTYPARKLRCGSNFEARC